MPTRIRGGLLVDGMPAGAYPVFGKTWFVWGGTASLKNDGKGADTPYTTVQAAVNAASAGDQILIGPGEYNEDVTISTGQIKLIGVGPRHSVRITGVAAGTSTPMTVAGASDVELYNLNLEARSGGDALKTTGQIRRLHVRGCKVHGGTNAIHFAVASGAQVTDIWLEDLLIMNATNGIFVDYTGGDPCHQIRLFRSVFSKITTDCIKGNEIRDMVIDGNIFGSNGSSEPTRFLDLDAADSSGIISNNVFATTVLATGKLAVDAGVIWVNNRTQAENPGTDAYATNGRPD